jgi:hypothetical protein
MPCQRRLLCLYSDPKEAGSKLAVLDSAGKLTQLDTPYSSFGTLTAGCAANSGGRVAIASIGASPTRASEAAVLFADSVDALLASKPSDWEVLRKSASVEVRHSRAKNTPAPRSLYHQKSPPWDIWPMTCMQRTPMHHLGKAT